jgi:hypothetical protein
MNLWQYVIKVSSNTIVYDFVTSVQYSNNSTYLNWKAEKFQVVLKLQYGLDRAGNGIKQYFKNRGVIEITCFVYVHKF